MLVVIHITGAINSGKSTVGRHLSELLPGAVFIDGDDHDAPDDATLIERVATALRRIESCIASAEAGPLVIAYPLESADHARVKLACEKKNACLVVVTLAPPLEVALSDRAERKLSEAERRRIAVMYREGYHRPPFSDLVLDTSDLTPRVSAERIATKLKQHLGSKGKLTI